MEHWPLHNTTKTGARCQREALKPGSEPACGREIPGPDLSFQKFCGVARLVDDHATVHKAFNITEASRPVAMKASWSKPSCVPRGP